MSNFIGYIGTYTKGDSKGIYSFTLDTEAKQIRDVQLAAELDNPTYVTISKDNRYLYAVVKEGDKGGAAAYRIEGGSLEALGTQVTEGASPCHVSVDSKKQTVVTANYHKGTIESYQVNEDGSLRPVLSVMSHSGSGPNEERQEKPHAHYAGFTPDEKYVIGVDLGTDEVITYEVKDSTLTRVHTLKVKAGSGPRHIAFHPNGKLAYVMTELSSEVIVLSYQEGTFTEVQYISTIPSDFTDNNQGSAIHLSADGRFVYAGNRGHNSIAVFRAEETGELTFVAHTHTEGDWPRDFMFDPTEQFLVASNQESSSLTLFARDAQAGTLTLLQKDVAVPYPVCVKFLHG
ncbi:lactonase family protein [Ectobacillus antri]|uniref:Lactonase family protein n=1 Tax=Ectobacillus antri TaxID=2486280 RepID=A0ABT6H7W1_9BACI|nr:lactonase family protein [Ectobacillus antri]MDG4657820.1 lactonase family protein [Ectobacillus antri]MDG5754789.1 lactonase family protein [Ectobacillus antri]